MGRVKRVTSQSQRIMWTTWFVADPAKALDFYTDNPTPAEYTYGVRATALDPDGNRISLRQSKRTRG